MPKSFFELDFLRCIAWFTAGTDIEGFFRACLLVAMVPSAGFLVPVVQKLGHSEVPLQSDFFDVGYPETVLHC